ncbi:MAG: tetratricopeptide repeat protein [Treponema sp.]|nr:tetratricopeptide repeat protein [Treponema sp.]
MQNQDEQNNAGERINEFIQKHRKPIFVSAGAIVLLLAICIAAFFIMDVVRGKAIEAVEELNTRYEALRPSINEEYSAEDLASLIADLEAFAKRNTGYAGGRALAIAGGIYSEKKEWAEAEAAWASAAKAAGKNYLTPVAWFNAGAAAEEQGKTEDAIAYYTSSITFPAGFAAAPRAQFSIGRLLESLNDEAAAIEAYRAVISGWPQDAVWNNLAHSRIVALEAK